MNFDEFGLSKAVLAGVKDAGFSEPTEIQVQTIPLVLQGRDVVGQAKTGTGKTAAFGLPILNMVSPRDKSIRALILVPVRELGQQVSREIQWLGKHAGIRTVCVYGGQSINVQLDELERRPQIVVGTPGRVIDLYQRRALDFSNLQIVVLDEADKMFEMGFREDIERILSFLPNQRQSLLFSATFNREIKQLATRHMFNPVEVNLSQDTLTVESVKQYFMMVHPKRRVSALLEVLQQMHVPKGVVFCRTKRTVDWLSRELRKRNVQSVAMHGDFSQAQRERTLDLFKKGRSRLLIATNVASRGLHIENISHVINFEMPEEDETYIHRIGRTARQGQTGVAVTFIENVMELEQLQRIQRIANTRIEELQSQHRY